MFLWYLQNIFTALLKFELNLKEHIGIYHAPPQKMLVRHYWSEAKCSVPDM